MGAALPPVEGQILAYILCLLVPSSQANFVSYYTCLFITEEKHKVYGIIRDIKELSKW